MTVNEAAAPVSVEEFLTIQELVARYCWYVDENQGEDWASLYTTDGIFEGTRPEPVVGREALAQVPGQLHGYFKGRSRHQVSNLYVERGEEPDTLTARFYNQVAQWDGGLKPLMLCVSTVTFVHEEPGGPWLIKRNSIRALS
jgi:hypothetical protein